MRKSLGFALLLACLLSAACGSAGEGNTSSTGGNTSGGNTSSGGGGNTTTRTPEPSSVKGDPTLADPKGSIAYQFELLKAGDVEKLRNCLTERLRDRVTKETVEKGRSQASSYTMDDLWASAEPGEYEGKKTMKVKMKNGRTLTTLVLTDGKWLADTLWFN